MASRSVVVRSLGVQVCDDLGVVHRPQPGVWIHAGDTVQGVLQPVTPGTRRPSGSVIHASNLPGAFAPQLSRRSVPMKGLRP